MTSLTLITGNRGKAAEFEALLGVGVTNEKIALTEIQALDVAEVARHKAAEAFEKVGSPVFVDDTGFALAAWGGLPGALIAWFLDTVGNRGVLAMADGLTDRSVEVKTALGYADEHGVRVFCGTLAGTLATEERGEGGFGYDPIFIPEGYDRTFAEMSADEKNAISMRRRAADAMKLGLDL